MTEWGWPLALVIALIGGLFAIVAGLMGLGAIRERLKQLNKNTRKPH